MNYSHYEIIAQAAAYAAIAHNGQTRRGDSTVPYIVHPARVAASVREFGGDWKAITVAWLHDVDEDCPRYDVAAFVNTLPILMDQKLEIVEMVYALTKDTSFKSRDDRLQDSIARIINAPGQAILVKICDRIDNLLDYDHENLRSTYYPGFAIRYITESRILLDAFGNYRGTDTYREPLSLLESRIEELEHKYSRQ